MEAGELGGALLFLLAAAAAVAVAVSVGVVDFSRPLAANAGLDFQAAVSWLIGVLDGSSTAAADAYGAWVAVRAGLIAPVLQAAVWACLVMSVMLVVEAVYNSVVSLGVKAIGWRPEWRFKWEPLPGGGDDEEKGSADYPMILVQIPMYNELEVYKLSIAAASELQWPKDRIVVQVLDDSTDPIAKPESDFLLRTVPFLMHNPEVALVQARWSFVNGTRSLLTRVQKMFFDYHFKVEQEAGSATFAFFSFNGTAGVWRTKAINDAGGWKDRTTVEDMDLAVRATLKGWKFIYAGDIRVKSELPSTYKAYCRQQFRWSSGGANLINFPEIGFSIFLCICASYNLAFPGTTSYYPYLYLQALAFLLLGLNFTGTCVCCQ
ncbi:hypothetical protein PR202_ga29075 [Eleusine coracana subsp. coracana]|uniref:Glycosyltransferase 2-like domain-containing protein n=1 Tax=Eleusine coracana subsp. coracana TaxID=191504 RepID=A0AAV5DKQ1_ELECO|nr:hypothetical protein PR202_ga29075 [Eleusine coracana subsp. coracana]